VTPRQVIRIRKTVIEPAGSWKVVTGRGGKMAASDFALSRRGSMGLGRGWHWRVDSLDANGTELRLLTTFNPRIEEFRSWLGYPKEGMLVIVARLEFHGSHPGWHCHSACCDVAEIEPGQPLHRQTVRIPAADQRHRKLEFVRHEAAALAAFRLYRVTGTPAGRLI
jgi:hypothetical protein